MRYQRIIALGLFVIFPVLPGHFAEPKTVEWGFYAHKLINRMAVFTLPGELIEFYKQHLEYIEDHAIDPDKRRYAVRAEAIRHYIDLDHWCSQDSCLLPRSYSLALIVYNHFYWIHDGKRTLLFDTFNLIDLNSEPMQYSHEIMKILGDQTLPVNLKELKGFIESHAFDYYDDAPWTIPLDSSQNTFPFAASDDSIEIVDHFSSRGILPYHLERAFYQLVNAFKTKNTNQILRLSADIGHYLGDAHVPLHTTKNYNGQLSNQIGIHAFWESRIPELFAENEFDFVVGPAQFIPDVREFIWNIVEASYHGVSLVLNMEKYLDQMTSPDQQYCFENRLGVYTKLQCKEYAQKYHHLLNRQVEDRMRHSILNLGSIWMTAWVHAGLPDLPAGEMQSIIISPDSTQNNARSLKIREHE